MEDYLSRVGRELSEALNEICEAEGIVMPFATPKRRREPEIRLKTIPCTCGKLFTTFEGQFQHKKRLWRKVGGGRENWDIISKDHKVDRDRYEREYERKGV